MKPAELLGNVPLQPIRRSQPTTGPAKQAPNSAQKTPGFSKVLAGQIAGKRAPGGTASTGTVKFSAHAQARMQERNIELTAQHLQRLDHGVALAEAKGSINSLVLLDDTAFIVSVKNKTVITAVPRHDAVDNVFTQIDSATIV